MYVVKLYLVIALVPRSDGRQLSWYSENVNQHTHITDSIAKQSNLQKKKYFLSKSLASFGNDLIFPNKIIKRLYFKLFIDKF